MTEADLSTSLVVSKIPDDLSLVDDHFAFFSHDSQPVSNRWYILPTSGHTPLARVGHAAVFLPPNPPSLNGQVASIGGANPDGTFSEINILNLDSLRWELILSPGFRPRYEHSAFFNKSQGLIYVFGGADMVENMNDIQTIDLAQKCANSVSNISGPAPSARTYRSHSWSDSKFYVYAGGKQGSDPVTDRQLRVFDVKTSSWTTLDTKGSTPKSRQGHSSVCVECDDDRWVLVVHAGMAGNSVYDDVHLLDLATLAWREVKFPKSRSANQPVSRAAHVAIPYKKGKMVIFGGLSKENVALNDCWIFNVETSSWRKIGVEGSLPPGRLDAAACIIYGLVPKETSEQAAGDYLFVTGGMNTEGDVFSDCFLLRLDSID